MSRNAMPSAAGAPTPRRPLLRAGLGVGIAAPLLGALATGARGRGSPAATPPASPQATPGASPAASPLASPLAVVTVKMTSGLRFDPQDVTIRVGQTIAWVNASPIPHTTTDDPRKNPVAQTHPDCQQLPAGAAPWDSGLMNQGQSFSHTFTAPGLYKYFCIPHILSGMRGMITVED